MVDTCVIPAAGKGSRWAPVSGYLPKEMLPLIDKPVIEWVIQDATASGIKKIVIVINKQKETIKDYLLNNQKLTKKAKFEFVYQKKPLGVAHAIYLCKDAVGQKPFGLMMPDLPVISRVPAPKQLIKNFDGQSNLISLDKFPRTDLKLYGECLLRAKNDWLFEISHFCPENKKPHHPGSLRMSGQFIFTPKIFSAIKKLLDNPPTNELTDRDALREALKQGQPCLGVQIQGHTYNTGTPKAYVRANTAFFKKFKMS
ncbi:hypothetical protein A2630_02310 [Candidatus Woesebacteria bacterium RIFCSPHIGHO2_01_FULL_44_10]|uniref:UTP--glucose-1-phosphate uridylyltransferase n=1 Tax=Candidatus Woesebacteria bacterium RIFCSPLOWO2_01_FULL_44_14 TaxID=1802525 RepID=A0A1F8C0N7_9BACT|nr:MAG: hypothetical protein A2630_02310 [Candidatus Woesebacteria bacterium RIFCSPHIGHO2_01_FULL_44_10]OGM53945.1 MAG: hypothetical protein A3F62_00030 [Candidatus Woesebacteria bacterium RIFCSPHIGHO2_12_FULL_44_11]OGM69913.1 MAG: hypothetical protein A2975_04870 [Candidatus Woesebacteria bacterium RIFCSPLOWO2_01_FULL_44_14]